MTATLLLCDWFPVCCLVVAKLLVCLSMMLCGCQGVLGVCVKKDSTLKFL